MQTHFTAEFLESRDGRRADEILRSCVHCGFCNATCPTYQLLGDELDGPRGRIYLIKDLLEAGDTTPASDRAARADVARVHLDRCLTCRACETTCPSGVAYGELLEIGRERLEPTVRRGPAARMMRWVLRSVVPYPARFAALLRISGLLRPLLPRRIAARMPVGRPNLQATTAPVHPGGRRVILLQGCVQRVTAPEATEALTALLARADIHAAPVVAESCCGGLALHLGDGAGARAAMRAHIDALWPHLDGTEAVLSTASGCGVTLRDYGRLLADDPEYADRAARLAGQVRDAAAFVSALGIDFGRRRPYTRIAWQAPCTLQHGQRITGVVETLLTRAGYELVPVADAHTCCGGAGSYSLLEPALSERLRSQKVDALLRWQPDAIATANVGCQLQLQSDARTEGGRAPGGPPVLHWLELLG